MERPGMAYTHTHTITTSKHTTNTQFSWIERERHTNSSTVTSATYNDIIGPHILPTKGHRWQSYTVSFRLFHRLVDPLYLCLISPP